MPHRSNFRGLDYNAITQEPARGVVVEAVNAGGTVLDTDTTDAAGAYSVTVDASTDVQIRVRSELQQTSGATWDIQVVDNTSGNAIYVLSGALVDSGTTNSTRNLNASSGWDPSANGGVGGYAATRAAGPFSILDAVYQTVTDIAAVDPDVTFPALQVFWSVNNRPSNTIDDATGDVGTSSYTRVGGVPTIRILGAENVDTDEYDIHVVVHEFGHYFEDQLSRSDSPGGSHSLNDRLDARLAFSEGWGNAFAGMILDDPNYRDALDAQQASGFDFSVEADLTPGFGGTRDPGWFNEASLQQILYDLYDSNSDGADAISGGLAPIYTAFTDPDYINSDEFATIFSFAAQIRTVAGINPTVLDTMLAAEDINGAGARGTGETNSGGLAQALPIYKTATVGAPAITVCSTDLNTGSQTGLANKLGVFDYVMVTINSPGTYTMQATRSSGAPSTDPDFRIWEQGLLFSVPDRIADSFTNNSETWTGTLDAGTYAIEFYDAGNRFETDPNDSCFDFTVS
ncbi:MAG: hypothetical protein AAGH49_12240 [Pseudomonadota bacterium]